MKRSNPVKLIISIALPLTTGFIGSAFTSQAIPTWYETITKPAFNPPSWVFAPVWTVLYVLMGIAAFLVWKQKARRKDVNIALGIFVVQLGLNALWSIIFFGLQSPGGALVEIVFLWAAILATMIAFAKVSKPAAWLLLPYLLWTSFAAFLNYSIWMLN